MSLIPYHPREGREIVLRHHNSIVVRDPDSHRLEIRRTECPTCHQPLGRASSPEGPLDRPYDMSHEYVNPDYFRMLRAGDEVAAPPNGPPSPIRRLFHPALAGTSSASPASSVAPSQDAEFVSSAPGVAQAEGSRIRRNAFRPNYFRDFFVEETVLGIGGKGVVLLVRHEIDGCQLGHFACKRVPVGDDHAWLEKVLVEVELLAKLSHPNLVSYRHVWLENVQLTRFGPSVVCAFILQQYCNSGDLHQYVVGSAPREATKEELKARMRRRSKGQAEPPRNLSQPKTQLSFEDIYSFFKDITSGVAYLHAASYIHRDLKPSNCLLHREGGMLQCLISDFGEVQAENVARKSTGSTGTISYCAPEVLKMDADGRYGNFTTKSDMFSLGMILYFMCFGRLPYQGANAIQEELEDIDLLRAEIADWKGFQDDERRERTDLPTRLYKLLKKLLSLDPAERPSATEVLIAMKSETSFDGFTGVDRGAATSSGPRGSRVQNLDSPAAPGTPAPDLRRERTRRQMTSHEESSSWPMPGNGDVLPVERDEAAQMLAQPDTSQRRGRTLTQPGKDHGEPQAVRDEAGRSPSKAEGSYCPPLLMAPPRNTTTEVRYQAELALHRASTALGLRRDRVRFLARLCIFLVKLGTLVGPCWPLAARLEVSLPLVVVAAVDLGLPGSGAESSYRQRRGPAGREPFLYGMRSYSTELGPSLILLAFHFAVLWLARRWSALCVAASHDRWQDR